ncbi:hypothetical protein PACTADRAFT_4972 [Pachysolen tannophilus NRRL Y-2460]|uniref:Uncharacterized protein n=1 Tax=Pachysolen tannophilus NRRL Y-2460 TaxID=669874 RepID=A0A1E4TN49_PACTA|nr:hypothetical protein PACTADRAFT_4972 [Pachysolen tannophilus NRRL Y-2460]
MLPVPVLSQISRTASSVVSSNTPIFAVLLRRAFSSFNTFNGVQYPKAVSFFARQQSSLSEESSRPKNFQEEEILDSGMRRWQILNDLKDRIRQQIEVIEQLDKEVADFASKHL